MSDRLIRLNAYIKTKLGLCCRTGCFHKSTVDVSFPQINVKRGLCDKHLLEFQKMELKGFIESEVEQYENRRIN